MKKIILNLNKKWNKKKEKQVGNSKKKDIESSLLNRNRQQTLVMLYNNNGLCPTPIRGGTKSIIVKHPVLCNEQNEAVLNTKQPKGK